MARQINSENSYRDILVKLIPSEVIGAFIAVRSVVLSANQGPEDQTNRIILLSAFAVLLLAIPFILKYFYNVGNSLQIACTMTSFLVWAYTLGGVFDIIPKYDRTLSAVILILWTVLIPLGLQRRKSFYPKDEVRIVEKKPSNIERADCFLEWNSNMSAFFSEETEIISVDTNKRTVRLKIDNGKNEWAFEWLTLCK